MSVTYLKLLLRGARASNSRGPIHSHRLLFSFHESIVNYPFTKEESVVFVKRFDSFILKLYSVKGILC